MAEESGSLPPSSSFNGFSVALIVFILFISLLTSYILSASYIIWRAEGIWRLPFGASAFKSLWAAIKSVRVPSWMIFSSDKQSTQIFYKNIDQEMIIIDSIVGDDVNNPVAVSPRGESRKSSRHSSMESLGVGILSSVSSSPLVRVQQNSPQTSSASEPIQIINLAERMEEGEMKCGSPLSGSLDSRKRRRSVPLNSGLLRIKQSIQAAQNFISPMKFWDWEPTANYDSAYSMPVTSNSFFAMKSPDNSTVSLLHVARSWDESRSRRQINYSTFSVDAY